MSNFTTVLQYELASTVRRRSFLLVAFGVPLAAVMIFSAVQVANRRTGSAGDSQDAVMTMAPEGLVDQSGLVEQVSPDIPPGALTLYPNETAARKALEEGTIEAYYIIPPDYVDKGVLIYISPRINPLNTANQSWLVSGTLEYNFFEQDQKATQDFWQPMVVEMTPLGGAAGQRSEEQQSDPFPIAYPLMMIFYILILTSSSLLMNSVTQEKKNRVIEVLLTTVQPRTLLAGKILALGVAGLLQTVLWMGTFYLLVRMYFPQVFGIDLNISAAVIAWGVVFFLLGYAVYASLMAALGALSESPREASQSLLLVIFPLVLPIFFFAVIVDKPHSLLALILSMTPFTAPLAMMTRLGAADVPLWQLLVSAGLLLLTAAGVLMASARAFQTRILLSGEKFTPTRYVRVLLGLDRVGIRGNG